MSDDIVAGLPIDEVVTSDDNFDPDAVDSDDFLPDDDGATGVTPDEESSDEDDDDEEGFGE